MSRYNRVPASYWIRSKGWEDRVRLLGVYVQTCDHRTTEGLYRLPAAYVAADLDWQVAVAERLLARLVDTGFVKYDQRAEVILLPSALEVQAPTTKKQIDGAVARIRMVPATPLLCELLDLATVHSNGLAEAIRMEMADAFESVVTQPATFHSNSQSLAHAHSSTAPEYERG